jgi:hypothetical protein
LVGSIPCDLQYIFTDNTSLPGADPALAAEVNALTASAQLAVLPILPDQWAPVLPASLYRARTTWSMGLWHHLKYKFNMDYFMMGQWRLTVPYNLMVRRRTCRVSTSDV